MLKSPVKFIKNTASDFKTFRNCPEIRSYIIQMYIGKVVALVGLVILSPLLILGLLSVVLMHIFDWVGSLFLTPFSKFADSMQKYQQTQIRLAHAELPIEEIQKRNGDDDGEILTKDGN